MPVSRSLIVFVFATFLSPVVAFGQQETDRLPIPLEPPTNLRFDHVAGGQLSQVAAILQDRYGYMWYGTRSAGLFRDDGYTMRRWVNDPDDPASISDQGIVAIAEDRRGGLWLGTRSSGLDHYDPVTDSFSHIRKDPDDPGSLSSDTVNTVTVDSSGAVWVGTAKGLNRFDPATRTITRFRHDAADASSLSNDWVGSVFVDRAGTFWAGSWGLNRYDEDAGAFVRYLPEPSILEPAGRVVSINYALSSSLAFGPSNWILSIHEDRKGRFWVGTFGGGLYRFDPESGTFGPNEMRGLSESDLSEGSSSPPGAQAYSPLKFVTSITDDPDGGLWVGSDRGLLWFDPERGSFASFRNDPTDPYSLSGDLIEQVYQDRQGVMWVSSMFKGLSRHDRAARPFEYVSNLELGPFGVYRIFEGPDGILWVTGLDALNRVDRSTGKRKVFRHVAGDPHSLAPTTDMSDVLVEATGRVWVSGTDVVSYMDPDRMGFFKHFRHDPADPASFPPGQATILFLDHSGTLWVGTDDFGLSRLDDRARGRFTHFLLGTDFGTLDSIFEDAAGMLWAGTRTRGLYRLDPRTGAVTNFDRTPGAPGGITGSTVMG
ncbi:MAG: two-component regulator propeller domain-containing protein, partial [Rhodothermales bacterium]